MLKESILKITNILFTPRCIICEAEPINSALCGDCITLIHAYPLTAFMIENQEYGALFYYEFTIQELIKKAKFHREIIYAHVLMKLVKDSLENPLLMTHLNNYEVDAVSFVPTSPLKKVLRGLDLPSMFASLVGEKLAVPVLPLLKKRPFKKALSQSKRRNDRFLAVKDSFSLCTRELKYKKILLIDDVFTTGATFDESKKMLKEIVKECQCLAIARTP